MTPICKDDGDVNDKNNYLPISVIDHIAKIESLVSYQTIDVLEEHSFISMDQSAYLKRHSTQTSLHRVLDDRIGNVNDCAIMGTCLLDISKCFDSINHTIRLKKSEMCGITSTELTWLSSYLRGRKQVVKFHQETSEFSYVIFIYLFIKTYLTRITHQPRAVLHEVLPYTTQLINIVTIVQHET